VKKNARESDGKKTFQYETNSNSAPFCSDSDSGFIDAEDPMSALKIVVKGYKHPFGLYAAEIREASEENSVLARYLSPRAATAVSAPCGMTQWKEDGLYVDDERIPDKGEVYELVEEKPKKRCRK